MEWNWVYVGMCFSCAVITFLPAMLISDFIGAKFFSSSFAAMHAWMVVRYAAYLALWWVMFKSLWGYVIGI